jgi:hypothetical protein
MSLSPQQLNDLRSRVLAGETIPPEELAEAIKQLRGARTTASATSTASKKAKTAKTPAEAQADLESLLGDIGL